MKLLPSRRVLCTPYNHALCHFMQSLIRKVHAYLAVTRHLHFWQRDSGLLRATAETHGWNWYRNKSQHRKLTLVKKILPPLRPGLELVLRSTTGLSPIVYISLTIVGPGTTITIVKIRLLLVVVCLLYCFLHFMYYYFMSPPWPQQNCRLWDD